MFNSEYFWRLSYESKSKYDWSKFFFNQSCQKLQLVKYIEPIDKKFYTN